MQNTSDSLLLTLGPGDSLTRAQLALDEHRWSDAITQARQAITVSQAEGKQPLAYLVLARGLWHVGDLVECCRYALRSEALATNGIDDAGAINAATLAAFGLTELNLELHALPLAQRALATAQKQELYQQLPQALSCAAHVYARMSDLDNSDALHMRALSLARETKSWPALQMAYDNLLVSFVIMLRNLEQRGDMHGKQVVVDRSRLYTSHVRSLLGNLELEEWRRGSLMHNLGELLLVSGELDEAQLLLQEDLDRTRDMAQGYSDALAAQTAMAELHHRRGEPEAALTLLGESLTSSSLGEAGYRRQLLCLQIAESSYQKLGRALEAKIMAGRIQNTLQLHEQMRGFAMQILPRPTEISQSF
ncbi:hypothetical protein LNV09_21405 [Paucibacter sp. B2R-40]|uniref:hypothetical protein n=1 Tax=Paucibacter sp. B2R-40 TaxID=2893554 RepID=UPI0021E4703F|nr:hypothetical protein [Paucibacter sp. B2R-40]MCV2356705.1 hypothetical protein [Paucibacter sp. B2R-40]